MPVSEIPALTTKKRRFSVQHSRAHDRRRCEPLGRSMLPREKFKVSVSKMPFPAFWDHSQWKIVEFFLRLSHWINYPGPRGFLLFFISKFCDANRFLYFFYWHEALRLDFRRCLVSGLPSPRRTAGRVSSKACLWRKFIIKILAVLLVVRNVIWWQSLAGSHDAYGS